MIIAKRLPPVSISDPMTELRALTDELNRRNEIIHAMMLSGADRSAIAAAILRFEAETPLVKRLEDAVAQVNARASSDKH
jgi:hypothetical protein